jgi:hypothetical protein
MIRLSERVALVALLYFAIGMNAICCGAEDTHRKWTSYMKEPDSKVEYFYDAETLIKPSNGLLQMWRKKVFPAGAAQKEIVTLDEIDCREARYRSLELIVTYWDGTTRRYDTPSPWANVYTSSVEEFLMDQHCK